jgi:hypothetical protein
MFCVPLRLSIGSVVLFVWKFRQGAAPVFVQFLPLVDPLSFLYRGSLTDACPALTIPHLSSHSWQRPGSPWILLGLGIPHLLLGTCPPISKPTRRQHQTTHSLCSLVFAL